MTSLTRRELLTAAYGAAGAALLSGCSGRDAVPLGRVSGASAERGHLVRVGGPGDVLRATAPSRWIDADVAIAGGGAAGLAAAWKLNKLGVHRVLLLELESSTGGTARSDDLNGIPAPLGAHYLPLPQASNPELIGFLESIGAIVGRDPEGEPRGAEDHLCRAPQERLWLNGRWYPSLIPPASLDPNFHQELARFEATLARFARARDPQGRPPFTLPLAACSTHSDYSGLDAVPFSTWLDQHEFRSPPLRWLVDYACRDEFGALASHVSAWAGLFYWCARLSPLTGQAQPVLTWPEGNAALTSHLARHSNAQVMPNAAVLRISPLANDGGVHLHVATPTELVGVRAKRAICALPAPTWPHVIPQLSPERRRWIESLQHGSWVVCNIHLSERPPAPPRQHGAGLAWDNVSYHSPTLGYVVATHQALKDYGPTVFTHYHALALEPPHQSRKRLYDLHPEHWAQACLLDLEATHPTIGRLATQVDVARWAHAMVQPTPGAIFHPLRAVASKPQGPIHFAHTDLSSMALFEEAFHHGCRAATEVAAALGA